MSYPKQRELCGVYFRVKRDDEWQNVCYSDMTPEERDRIAEMRSEMPVDDQVKWWRSLADAEADALYRIGEELNVVKEWV